MVELFAKSGDPDQMPHSATSDLGLHCSLNSADSDQMLQNGLQTTMG